MAFFLDWGLGWTNAFWFTLLSLATSFVLARIFPEHFRKRVFTMPEFKGTWQMTAKRLNMLCLVALLILPIFMPVKFESGYFIPGVFLFLMGYVLYISSLVNYATTEPNRPVIKGVYRYSRNPQQITTLMMWAGVGLVTESLLILSICGLQLALAYPSFLAQEDYCLKRYGEEYKRYMAATPRYLLFF